MRRSLWSRILAGWLACWLPLVLADAGWLHACPMHGSAVRDGAGMMLMAAATPAVAMAPVIAPVMASGMAHAMRPMTSAADQPAAHGPSHRGHSTTGHACTCLGACCAALAVLPGRSAALTVAAVERRIVAPTGRPQHEYVAAWVDFVLPFATAPPARG